jgi:hypothetical protein
VWEEDGVSTCQYHQCTTSMKFFSLTYGHENNEMSKNVHIMMRTPTRFYVNHKYVMKYWYSKKGF